MADVKSYFDGDKREDSSNQSSHIASSTPSIDRIPEFVFLAQEEMPLNLEVKNGAYRVYNILKYS